ncbi:hypothetical protein Cus16_1123 [Curtobacterium sp. ER1/6]|nr:hypothetical protein Cus16_1123 [Curtobacterium sp. ER1/6]
MRFRPLVAAPRERADRAAPSPVRGPVPPARDPARAGRTERAGHVDPAVRT